MSDYGLMGRQAVTFLQDVPNLTEGLPEKVEKDHELKECRVKIMSILCDCLPSPNCGLLDIGPAMGWELDWFQEYAKPVEALTLFEEEAKPLRERGHSVTVSDMHTMPGEWDNKFSGVFACHVLEHSPSPIIFISEIGRVLMKGGVFVLAAPPAGGGINVGNIARFKRMDNIKCHIFFPDAETVIAMIRRVGLTFTSYQEVPQYSLGKLCYWNKVWIGKK